MPNALKQLDEELKLEVERIFHFAHALFPDADTEMLKRVLSEELAKAMCDKTVPIDEQSGLIIKALRQRLSS